VILSAHGIRVAAVCEALSDGVSRASLPTPFHVGRVNCYLLVGPPVTVIDPGTLQAGSMDELAAGLPPAVSASAT
jgi:hypothetical protein